MLKKNYHINLTMKNHKAPSIQTSQIMADAKFANIDYGSNYGGIR